MYSIFQWNRTVNKPPSPVVELTELLQLIFIFLDQYTLKFVAARVSRKWFYVAQKSFRHSLQLHHLDSKTFRRKNLRSRLSKVDHRLTVGKAPSPWVLPWPPIYYDFRVSWDRGSWEQMTESLRTELEWTHHYAVENTNKKNRNIILRSRNSSNNRIETDNNGGDGVQSQAQQDHTRLQNELGIKELYLYLSEGRMSDHDKIMSWFDPTSSATFTGLRLLQLQELVMDLPKETLIVRLDSMLNPCPNLLRLSLSCVGWKTDGNAPFWEYPWLEIVGTAVSPAQENHGEGSSNGTEGSESYINNSNSTREPLPLRVLRLKSLTLNPRVLATILVPRLPNLRELSLLDIRHPKPSVVLTADHVPDPSPEDISSRRQLWRALADLCPELHTIRYNSCEENRTHIPIHLFPRIESWAIDSRCVHESNLTWQALMTHSIENRLTTLDFVLGGWTSHNCELSLHRFLCASPLLLHLNLDQLSLKTDVFWGKRRKLQDCDHEVDSIWACRGLRTLSLRIDNGGSKSLPGPPTMSRLTFGYLSRVCPKLLDLKLIMDCQLFSLESGLLLLTRLNSLRRLAIYSRFYAVHSLDNRYIPGTMTWIQGWNHVHPSSSSSMPRVQQQFSSLVLSFFRHPSSPDSPQVCLDMMESLSRFASVEIDLDLDKDKDLETKRCEMQALQKENRYLTDHDRATPIVDGLADIKFCGSTLDIEARLLAQKHWSFNCRDCDCDCDRSHHHQHYQQHQNNNDEGDDNKASVSGLVQQPQRPSDLFLQQQRQQQQKPWPWMEQLRLSFGGCRDGQLAKAVIDDSKRIQRDLQKLRSEIEIICEASVHDHRFHDLIQ